MLVRVVIWSENTLFCPVSASQDFRKEGVVNHCGHKKAGVQPAFIMSRVSPDRGYNPLPCR